MAEQELMPLDKPVAVFDEFRAQLGELREWNDKSVFDYEEPKGNKEARSHIYQLRRSKAAVEAARKEEKRIALEYGRKVDSEAKEIIGELEDMIAVHQKPLDEIEARENARVKIHQDRIENIRRSPQAAVADNLDSEGLAKVIDGIEDVDPDEFEEFQSEAWTARENALTALKARLVEVRKAEAEREELARLRAEEEARRQREAAEAEAKAAEERERKEADAARERELEQARREAAEARAAQLRAEQEAQAAKDQARREAEAEARRKEVEAREAAERAEAERRAEREAQEAAEQARAAREADAEIRDRVRREIQFSLTQVCEGIPTESADEIALALMEGLVSYCKVEY